MSNGRWSSRFLWENKRPKMEDLMGQEKITKLELRRSIISNLNSVRYDDDEFTWDENCYRDDPSQTDP